MTFIIKIVLKKLCHTSIRSTSMHTDSTFRRVLAKRSFHFAAGLTAVLLYPFYWLIRSHLPFASPTYQNIEISYTCEGKRGKNLVRRLSQHFLTQSHSFDVASPFPIRYRKLFSLSKMSVDF